MRSTRSSALRCPSCRRNALTMKSRLLDRFPPAGRTRSTSMAECMRLDSGKAPSMTVAVMLPATFFGGERRAAAAGGCGVRILDREAAAGDRFDEVDFGAFQVPDADRIDIQLDAVRLEHLIAVAAVFFNHQSVLKARAPAALHEHAQSAVLLLLFGKQLCHLRGCGSRHIDHVISPGRHYENLLMKLYNTAAASPPPIRTRYSASHPH